VSPIEETKMIIDPGTTMSIALVGFDRHDHTVLKSLFKISGIYHEWESSSLTRPDCILLDADQDEAHFWYDEEMQNRSGVPIVTVGTVSLGNAVTHIPRPFRWGQVLETLELAIEQSRQGRSDSLKALSTTLDGPSSGASDPASALLPRIYNTMPAALIVNPNPKGWRYVTGELARRGYRVDHVSSGAAAVLLLANFRYNLVFVETHLPDEDGVGICRMLKQAHGRRRIAAIILSTNRKAVDRIRGKFAGCDAFISTPVDPDELRRTLDKLVPEYELEHA
jgi:two-component system cell cycle response regulator